MAKLTYLSAQYFDEIVYRIENSEGFVKIGVKDENEWLEAFKKARPCISSIRLKHVKGNIYSVSADI